MTNSFCFKFSEKMHPKTLKRIKSVNSIFIVPLQNVILDPQSYVSRKNLDSDTF